MSRQHYLMEHDGEIFRLETKTDEHLVRNQALWAGMKEGMTVADIGCGTGKTTSVLQEIVGDTGTVFGFDVSPERIEYARRAYPLSSFHVMDARSIDRANKTFDFVWVRFFLEYFRTDACDLVRNFNSLLNPGGILCLIDLDYNCMSHFELDPDLEQALIGCMEHLRLNHNFDPYMGRKLYSYLFDLGYEDIRVHMHPYHLFFGELDTRDEQNWIAKLDVAVAQSGYTFPGLEGGFLEFRERMHAFLRNPRRFTYTPCILCRGVKPGCR